MLEDQRYWVREFLTVCLKEKPDAVLIAGDVYDRSAPSGDAVELLDYLLTELAEKRIPVFLIAGNHDSGQRLSFGRSMLAKQNIHIAGTVTKEIEHVTLDDPDGFGPVTFWLVPYLFPELVAELLGDETIRSYDTAFRKLLAQQAIDFSRRNVILSHQNVTVNGLEAERGGSETMIGGVGQIDYSAYAGFDYAALGHIHSAYTVGRPEVRYAGTPLCYHLNETRQQEKGPVEVILKSKGQKPEIRTVSIQPLHRMRWFVDTKENVYQLLKDDPGQGEYVGIILTDERVSPEIDSYLRGLLEARGSILMELISEYHTFNASGATAESGAVETKSLEELFYDLYTEQNGGMNPSEEEFLVMQYVGELVRNQDPHQPLPEKDCDRLLKHIKEIGGQK